MEHFGSINIIQINKLIININLRIIRLCIFSDVTIKWQVRQWLILFCETMNILCMYAFLYSSIILSQLLHNTSQYFSSKLMYKHIDKICLHTEKSNIKKNSFIFIMFVNVFSWVCFCSPHVCSGSRSHERESTSRTWVIVSWHGGAGNQPVVGERTGSVFNHWAASVSPTWKTERPNF